MVEKIKDFVFDDLVGRSKVMQDIFAKLKVISGYDVTVLIEGESGTGKELVARALHYNSPRKDNEFVIINCSSFSDSLLESELFGHVKGSFTGALTEKKGLFEVADNGTFFLDEIADMSPALQVKLLRVLQEGTFLKVGGTTPVKVNVRIIAATNKKLEELVKEKKFRDDLYYRINVLRIKMPPLRERKEDTEILVKHILIKLVLKTGEKKQISAGALKLLESYDWPGNVRELENELEKALIFSKGKLIDEESLSHGVLGSAEKQKEEELELSQDFSLRNLKKQTIERVEKEAILAGLAKTGWNKSACAKLLKVSRQDLIRKIARYKLPPQM